MNNELTDKISFRVSKELKARLKENSERSGLSLTNYILYYLETPLQETQNWAEYQKKVLEFKKQIDVLKIEKSQLQEKLKQSIPLSKVEEIKRKVKDDFHPTYSKEISEAYEMGYKDGYKDRSK
ncbi:hypothetical protein VB776_04475 [Arcicella sp. DC2W]|uniref:Uncharacterized protein n=1 Tax=Arcicella gelida TaxID=2984195 RepID=A0ABU5S1H6_9BACT|nr:hypothetical protein [Arcicella sp. DC2W]MEA5402153.1 hypothetical protein [Arcicella sp. DC2W]